MINLLPPKEKIELEQEKKFKLFLILGIVLLSSLICFALILASINILVSGEKKVQEVVYQQKEREFEDSQIKTIQQDLIGYNKTLLRLSSFYEKQVNLTEILEEISSALPAEIYLTNLSITTQDEELNCVLSGFAPTRERLLDFKDNLEKEVRFEEILFPPSNWEKRTDINFTVSFKVK